MIHLHFDGFGNALICSRCWEAAWIIALALCGVAVVAATSVLLFDTCRRRMRRAKWERDNNRG